MRYDAESGKIGIELKEFVTLARRSLSTFNTRDEDEPRLAELTVRRLTKIIGEHTPERLYFEFSSGGFDFEMSPYVSALSENEITLGRIVESLSAKPNKHESRKENRRNKHNRSREHHRF